jgi:hypothetical protein
MLMLAMVIRYYVKKIKKAFEVPKFNLVSLPICMYWFMDSGVSLCKIHYKLVGTTVKSKELGRNIVSTVFMN